MHWRSDLIICIKDVLKPLVAKGIIEPLDVVKLHSYRALAAQQRIGSQRNHPHKWALGALSKLGMMARAMGYLVGHILKTGGFILIVFNQMEASIGMCLKCLQDFVAGKDKDDRKNAQKSALKNNTTFQKLLSELEAHRIRPGGFGMHPKMDTLKLLLMQHFGSKMTEDSGNEQSEDGTKAMVFVTYRDCVDEIVDVLNEEKPLLRATKFIGQGQDKQGRKGLAQKEQLEVRCEPDGGSPRSLTMLCGVQVIKKFKSGEFNILVSTSIGEEGLDIGEVDMIICYDAQKTPIRMVCPSCGQPQLVDRLHLISLCAAPTCRAYRPQA